MELNERSRADCPLLLFVFIEKEYGKTGKKQRNAIPCFFCLWQQKAGRMRFLF